MYRGTVCLCKAKKKSSLLSKAKKIVVAYFLFLHGCCNCSSFFFLFFSFFGCFENGTERERKKNISKHSPVELPILIGNVTIAVGAPVVPMQFVAAVVAAQLLQVHEEQLLHSAQSLTRAE